MKVLLGIFVVTYALSAAPVTPVTLLDAGNPLVYDGAHYVGPYTVRIGGSDVPVLCIDFRDESSLGNTWSANLSRLNGNLRQTYVPADQVQYKEEAYLLTAISLPGADRIDLQHAAWAIMDSHFVADKAASQWILQAEQNYSKLDLSRYEIISDVQRASPSRNQEFVAAVTPEPPFLQLAAGLLALAFASLGAKNRRSTKSRR
jgi:hypothetical protein